MDYLLQVYSLCVHAKLLQSSLTLFDPMDCSPPGSSVHGILQARILEWVAMPSYELTFSSQWQPTPVFLPGESQGQQSLVGCLLWGRTELDMIDAT